MSKEAEEWFESDDRPDFSGQRKALVFGYHEVMRMMDAYAKHFALELLNEWCAKDVESLFDNDGDQPKIGIDFLLAETKRDGALQLIDELIKRIEV